MIQPEVVPVLPLVNIKKKSFTAKISCRTFKTFRAKSARIETERAKKRDCNPAMGSYNGALTGAVPLTSAGGCDVSEEGPGPPPPPGPAAPGLNLSLGLLSPGLLGTDLEMASTLSPSLATTQSVSQLDWARYWTQYLHHLLFMHRNIMQITQIS